MLTECGFRAADGAAGICAAVNSNQGMAAVWAEVEAGLTTGQK